MTSRSRVLYFVACIMFCFCALAPARAQVTPGIRLNGNIIPDGDTVKLCQNTTAAYVSTASGATIINWTFAGGNPGSSTSFGTINVAYASPGVFATRQIVSTNAGATDSATIYVDVSDTKPVPDFTFTPNNECGNVLVKFTNTSQPANGLTYLWNFGDATTSTATSPDHQFLTAVGLTGTQNFTVTLTARNEYGCTAQKTNVVTVKRIPDASLDNVDQNVTFSTFNDVPTFRRCFNQPSYSFSFRNVSTTNAAIASWKIEWGDGISPDSVFTAWPLNGIINHTYPLGNSTMTLTAFGTGGCNGIKKYNVFLGTTPAGGISSPGNTAICAPQALTFALNGISNNSPGTSYTFSVNDGTLVNKYLHPAPANVTHDFLSTSCGTTADAYTNAFKVTLLIENPCGSTSGNVIPIYVSSKPRSRINIAPDTVICTGTPITASYQYLAGGEIRQTGGTGSTCGTNSKYYWEVSPSANVTVTGIRGDNGGNPLNYLLWNNGAPSLGMNFSAPGTYRVTLYTANGCGVDTTYRTICVRTPPVASFTMDKKESCGPGVAAFTNTTVNAGCNGNRYTWSVQYIDDLNCGAVANSYQFTSSTGSASVNPRISFNNPGKYIITLSATINSNFNVCIPTIYKDSFLVKGKPKVAITQPTNICLNNSVTPVANVSNCYGTTPATYAWTFPNGNPATSSILAPGAILFNAVGTQAISLSVENECGITTDTKNLVVTNLPVANAGPDKTFCSGIATSIGTTAVGGITYLWTPSTGLSNPAAAITNVNFVYTGANNDTTIQYVVRASSGTTCFNTDTVLVTISKSPQLNIFPATAEVCAGSPIKLYVNGGETYTWSPAATLSTNTGDTVYATPLVTTIYTVNSTLASGGCAATKTITVVVKPLPATNAGRDSTVCINSTTVQLTGTPAGGVWTGTNISTTGVFNAQNAGIGSFQQIYTATLNGCSRSDTMLILVISQPVADAGLDTTVCAGAAAFNLQGSPSGGRWSGTNQVNAAGLFTPTLPGTYTLTYTIGSGTCMAMATRRVIVQPGISGNQISASQTLCNGIQAQPITGTTPTGGDGNFVFQWQSSPDGTTWQNINGANGPDYQPPVNAGTTFFRRLASTGLCVNNASNAVRIEVNLDAKAEFTATTLKGCAPFNLNASVIRITPYADRNANYQWFANGVSIGTNTTGAFPGYTITNANATVTIRLLTTSKGGCKSDFMELTFVTVSNPAPAFTQSTTGGCGPVAVTFTNTTADIGNFNYLWDFGNGITSQLQQPGQVIFQPHPLQADTIYTIKLKATGGCDTIVATLPVTVKSKPKSLFSPDITEGCSPMKVNFTNVSRGNGNTYEWNFGDGSPLVTGNGAQTHVFTVTRRDSIKVRLVSANSCGNDTLTYIIIVNPNSIKLDFAVNGNEKTGCLPHTVRFVNNSSGANTYNWNFGDGQTISTLRGVDTIVHTYTQAGNFDIRLQGVNTCNDTLDFEKVTVIPKPKVGFLANPTNACYNDSIRFTNQSDVNINYLWLFGDGSQSILTNPVKAFSQPGNFNIRLIGSKTDASGLVCSDTAARTVSIGGATGSLRNTSGYVCLNTSVRFEGLSPNATQFKYVFGDGDSLTTTSALVNHVYTRPGIYVPNLTLIGGSCLYKTTGDTIRVDRIKAGFRMEQQYECGRTIVRFIDTSYSYFAKSGQQWNFGDNTISTQTLPQRVYTEPGTYMIRLVITGISGCMDTVTVPLDVKIRTLPGSDINSQATGCTGQQISFDAVMHSSDSVASYQWAFGNALNGNGKNVQTTFSQAGNYFVRLIGRTIFGCVDTAYKSIVIRSSPVINAGPDARICRGANTFLQASGATTYQWFSTEAIACTTCSGSLATPLYNTTYVVAGTNELGCTAYDSLTVTVIQPFKIALTVKDTICFGESTQLLALNADRYVWSPEIGLSNPNIANPVAKPNGTTPYKVVGYDRFGCFTDSAWVLIVVGQYPAVDLGTGGTVVAGTPITFNPVIVNGPVKTYTWSPDKNFSCKNCATPMTPVDRNTVYQLSVENIYGCKATDTIGYKVYCDLSEQVFVPNAFSPDGDGVNDVLMVRGKGITAVKYFRIFNRWGQVVFERSNISVNDASQAWDGRINGIAAQPDVYVYTLELDCTAGGGFVKKGNITLIR